jgi:predicted lipoprotein
MAIGFKNNIEFTKFQQALAERTKQPVGRNA